MQLHGFPALFARVRRTLNTEYRVQSIKHKITKVRHLERPKRIMITIYRNDTVGGNSSTILSGHATGRVGLEHLQIISISLSIADGRPLG